MTHEEYKFGGSSGQLDPEAMKIVEVLSGLERVEAPGDFDVRVRARIAQGRPAEVRPVSLFPFLKYVLPLVLFLFTGAGVLYFSSLSDGLEHDRVSVPDTASPTSVAEMRPDEPPIGERPVSPVPATSPEIAVPVMPAVRRAAVPSAERVIEPPRSRSIDFSRPTIPAIPSTSTDRTLLITPPAITPPGVSLEPVDARAAFELLGVDAEFRNGEWTVRSVNETDVGKKIGIRPGDRLKAIDGKPILEGTKFNTGIGGSVISVQRDGRMIDLSLINQPK